MKKIYPCVEVDLSKIRHNSRQVADICKQNGIEVFGVTKVFCAQRPIVNAMLQGGIQGIGDSRIENLKKLKDLDCSKMLLRIPMESNLRDVVKYSDVSLNSEVEVVRMISKTARRMKKVHNVILMVDLGDLREGILVDDAMTAVSEIIKLDNINLVGLGTNLTCYGSVIPDEKNLGELVRLKKQINEEIHVDLPVISGGNSSSLYMVLNGSMPEGINMLRIGEAIVLGRETSYGKDVPNCYKDAFVLKGEIVELKNKPTVPTGTLGMDAFGETHHFEDKGIRKRAIVAFGRQDVRVEGLKPMDGDMSIFGASSDHLLIDVTECSRNYKLGDVVDFTMDYGCLLAAMTSPYVKKYYVNEQD